MLDLPLGRHLVMPVLCKVNVCGRSALEFVGPDVTLAVRFSEMTEISNDRYLSSVLFCRN